ncbi:MAG: bifunctional nuclease family protein [Chloroflexi bacterium]|nr:bifunctional nuclease family protein [Chloroflexota bacterium]
MIEVTIDSVRVSLTTQQRIVVLKDNTSDRYLAIFIGPFEADAITYELQEIAQRRPLTHDLMKTMIEELGATLVYVLVSDIRDDIYYARLVLDTAAGKRIEIDCRPSDAIAIAVRAKVPLYVAEPVLDRAGIRPESDVEVEVEEGEGEAEASDAPVDSRKLSAFADFLDTLDLDDLGAEDDK